MPDESGSAVAEVALGLIETAFAERALATLALLKDRQAGD